MFALKMKSLLLFTCICCCLAAFSQDVVDIGRERTGMGKNNTNRFTAGFAAVTVNDRSFYIDTLGVRAFDSIDERDADKLGDEFSIGEYKSNLSQYPEYMPKPVVKVWKDGRAGLLNPMGEWLLPAVYADIDVRFPDVWKVKQQGRESYYGKAGLLLPFFDEVGYLDGVHFDVRNGGRWGIYNGATEKMVVPVQYEKVDYCGGCGRKPTYVYARKDGKWGVVDFHGKVLVDFEYDHSHWGMRGDEWVQSFTKDGRQLLVHIPTRKEYRLGVDEGYRFLAGSMLAYAADGKFGVIDKHGKQLLPAEYDDVRVPNDNHYQGYYGPYALIEKAGKTGVIQRDGTVLFQPEWDDVMVYDDFFVLTKNGRSALLDSGKNELLPAAYSEITHIKDYFYSSGSNGISIFKIKDKALYGLYFPETEVSVNPAFHSVRLVSVGEAGDYDLIECENQGRKALYNLLGEEVLPLRYQRWSSWGSSGDLLQVQLNGKWGLYNFRLGQEVIPCAYDHVERLGNTSYVLLEVWDYGSRKWGIRHENGDVLLDSQFSTMDEVGDGRYLLTRDDGTGGHLFDAQSGEVQELAWQYVWNPDVQNLLLVSQDGQTGFLYDATQSGMLDGKYNVSLYSDTYEEALRTHNPHPVLSRFRHGVAEIRVDNKIGFVDSLGRQIIAPQFDAATSFNADGIAAVGKRRPVTDSWGSKVDQLTYRFVDKSGAVLSSMDYPAPSSYFSDMDYFLGEHLIIRLASEDGRGVLMGLQDMNGHTILDPAYDAIEELLGGNYFLLQQGQRFGIADKNGKIILPALFEDILVNRYTAAGEQLFPLLCKQSSGWKYYTKDGTVLTVEGMMDSDVFEVNQWGW